MGAQNDGTGRHNTSAEPAISTGGEVADRRTYWVIQRAPNTGGRRHAACWPPAGTHLAATGQIALSAGSPALDSTVSARPPGRSRIKFL